MKEYLVYHAYEYRNPLEMGFNQIYKTTDYDDALNSAKSEFDRLTSKYKYPGIKYRKLTDIELNYLCFNKEYKNYSIAFKIDDKIELHSIFIVEFTPQEA